MVETPAGRVEYVNVETGKRLKEAPLAITPPDPMPPESALANVRWQTLPPSAPKPQSLEGKTLVGNVFVNLDTGVTEPCRSPACKNAPPRGDAKGHASHAWSIPTPTGPVLLWQLWGTIALARGLGTFDEGGEDARLVVSGLATKAFFCRVGPVVAPLALCEGRFVTASLADAP